MLINYIDTTVPLHDGKILSDRYTVRNGRIFLNLNVDGSSNLNDYSLVALQHLFHDRIPQLSAAW